MLVRHVRQITKQPPLNRNFLSRARLQHYSEEKPFRVAIYVIVDYQKSHCYQPSVKGGSEKLPGMGLSGMCSLHIRVAMEVAASGNRLC